MPSSSMVVFSLTLPYWTVGRMISISAIVLFVLFVLFVADVATPLVSVGIVVHLGAAVLVARRLSVLVVPVVVVRTGAHPGHSYRSTGSEGSGPCWPGSCPG